jgi:hypothetical protein
MTSTGRLRESRKVGTDAYMSSYMVLSSKGECPGYSAWCEAGRLPRGLMDKIRRKCGVSKKEVHSRMLLA